MIIWLASYPRSGNTYYRMLLHHAAGFASQTAYDHSLMERIGAAAVVGHQARTRPLAALQADEALHFVKSHELPADANPAVYIVRDGRDVLVSYAHFLNDTARAKEPLQRARRRLLQRLGIDDFRRTLARLIVDSEKWGGWSNHVLSWTVHRSGAVTAVVRYEDLVAAPLATLRRSLDELAIPAGPLQDETPDFASLQQRWPGFFRQGRAGAWRDEMPGDLHALFWERHGPAMEALGYGRAGAAPG